MKSIKIVDKDKKELVSSIAKESIRLLSSPSKLLDDECPLDKKAAALLIGETIRRVLDEVLGDRPLRYSTAKETHNHVRSNYADMKHDLEVVIGLAFTYAVKRFSKEELQYLCEISPVGLKNNNKDS